MFKTRLKYLDGTLIYYGHTADDIITFEIPFIDTNYSFSCNVTISKGMSAASTPVNLIANSLLVNKAELQKENGNKPSFTYIFIGRWK